MSYRCPHSRLLLFVGLLAAGALALAGGNTPPEAVPFTELLARLQKGRFIDLTHAFTHGNPALARPAGRGARRSITTTPAPEPEARGSSSIDTAWPASGAPTWIPPAHFVKGLRTLDQIDVREMVLPLVVIDVHQSVQTNPDYAVTLDDVRGWERRHGEIPAGSFVALRTDWSKRWPDAPALRNVDAKGISHTPGWSREVLQFLYETRKIAATGHETPDTDPGVATSKDDYSLELYVLSQNKYQIEMLANLDQVPEHGAIVVAAFPKPRGGSGFPARVFAIAP